MAAFDPAKRWFRWFEVFNDRDWDAWEGLAAAESVHVTVGADGSVIETDTASLRGLHKSMAGSGATARLISVAANGSSAVTTFEFGSWTVSGLVLYGPDGLMIRSWSVIVE